MSVEPAMQSNHLILCHPLFLLPSIFPSTRVFSKELALCIRWSKYWSFSISPSNEYSGLISFKIDWFDLLEVQGTLKSLLQHHNSFIQLTFIFPCRGLNPVHGAYSRQMKDPILFHLSALESCNSTSYRGEGKSPLCDACGDPGGRLCLRS